MVYANPTSNSRPPESKPLATKGLTRSEEAYCLSCYEMVERSASKCPSCNADFTEEVRAFNCPKCQTIMALGAPNCPNCGLKFKIKTIKAPEPAKDDKFLMKLIEWGKASQEQRDELERQESQAATPPITPPKEPAPSEEQLLRFAKLKESINDLMANRSQMLERMEARIAEEKKRLTEISNMDGKSASAQRVEEEIVSLATEMADITMLQAHMESLSEDITELMSSVEISEAAKARGLAARALKKQLEAKEKELDELRDKEEQIQKREEMVDRKIQAYAQKKKLLDDQEEELKKKLMRLEQDRAELEKLKSLASGARSEAEREQAKSEWIEEQKRLRTMLLNIHSTVMTHRAGREPTEQDLSSVEGDLDAMISGLEKQIAVLIAEKVDLQKKTADAMTIDEDMRKLLKVLDQMLGQLPESVIERFSKSDEFALYERVLDKFKV